MHPYEHDKNHNSTFGHTIRYIGFSFAGLAFVLIVVCATSLRITKQVQRKYDEEVLQALTQLKLASMLHHNEDMMQHLLIKHISTASPTRKRALREEIRRGRDENKAAIHTLEQLVKDKTKKELLLQVKRERTAYYSFADELIRLSDQGRTVEATAFAKTYLDPSYRRHEQYLNRLSRRIQATTDSRVKAAVADISASIDRQTLLLVLAMASAVGAAFIISFILRRMRRENTFLNVKIRESIELEQELSEQKREYKMLFNRNPIPMWLYDQDTYRFLEVNEAATQEYGYTEEEFRQMTLFDIRTEEAAEKLQQEAEHHAVTEGYEHKRKDGSSFKVEVRWHTLPRKQHLKPGLMVAVNVQEREQALEQLRKNEKLLREVSSSVPGVVYQYQMEGDGSFCFPYISEGVLELCGVTPEEVYRDPPRLYKNLHPDDLIMLQHTTAMTYKNLTPWEQELRVWQPEQEKYIWLRGHSLPTAKGNGTVLWNGTFINITKQKETQEELRRNEAKLRALLDSSLQAIFLLDENMKVLSFNKEAAADVRRYTLKDIKAGQSMVEYVNHAQVQAIVKNHARAMCGETVVYEAGQGDYWHEITYQPVVSPEHSILGVALNIRDISEQKKNFETIRRNELQLDRAQQLAKLGSWEYHVQQNVLTWSDGTYAIYGLKKGSFMPSLHNMLARTHPGDRAKVQAAHQEAIDNKSLLNIEHRILLPDGAEANVLEVAEVICDSTGKVIKLYGTVQDVTERKKAEQEITEAKNLLQTTIENIPEVIFTADPDLSIVYISPQCEQITGYPEEAFLGGSSIWLKAIHSEDKKPLMQLVLKEVLAGHPQEYEMRMVDSQGRLRWLLLRMSPGLDRAGKVTRIYGSASDMTAYKEAEARQQKLSGQLLKQNQNLQQFAYIVSHNLRAPIANILGLTSIYNRNEIGSPINQKVIDNLVKSAQLLDGTIRDLNDILTIRSQAGNVNETVSFECLLQDVLELLKVNMTACEAAIVHDFSAAPTLSTVRSYAQSILLNLLSNAVKYKSPDRKLVISIKTLKVKNYICLRVQDNGLGIDLEKQQENIFGLYKRFHKGVEGRGIGLHLVKTQIEMLEGKVEVESRPQEGTSFNVYFKS